MADDVANTAATGRVIKYTIENDPGTKYFLNDVTDEHARQFRRRYRLEIEERVFVRGVLAIRHRDQLESAFRPKKGQVPPAGLEIDEHRYTDLEFKVLRRYWSRNRRETLRHLSRLHWILIVACVFAAMTQGWDQAAMAGAAIEVMNSLGKPIVATAASDSTSTPDINDLPLTNNTWLFGFFVGAPFIFGAPIGLIVTDRVTEVGRFGRRGAICVAGLFSFASVIGSASVHTWWEFLIFRALLGVGMAGKASVVPILLSETAPKNIRGTLLVCWQLFVAFGLATGSVANISVYHLNARESWRYMFISAFIPALLLFSLVLFSPESPRWLLKKSGVKHNRIAVDRKGRNEDTARVQQALKSLIQLHNDPTLLLAAGELYLLYRRLIEEQKELGITPKDVDDSIQLQDRSSAQPQTDNLASALETRDRGTTGDAEFGLVLPINYVSWSTRWRLMFQSHRLRRANYAAASVMIAQQLCGINLLAFLADTFFRNSFFEDANHPTVKQNTELLAFSLGFGVWNFVCTIPALFFIDNPQGRRRLLNWSFPCMCLSLLISGLLLLAPPEDPVTGTLSKPVVAFHFVFLAAFTTAYSIGEGPAAFVVSAEVFPLVNRELGMSLAVFWNFTGAGLLALLAPVMTKRLGQVGTLGLFSGLNLVAWFACYCLVPDTGREELEKVFKRLDIPTTAAFRYTCASTWQLLTRPIEFCRNGGKVKWSECGDKALASLEDWYNAEQADGKVARVI